MNGIIEINGLRLFARHGVYEQERINGNLFELSVHLVYPFDRAMLTDGIADTLDYTGVIDIVRKEMDIPSDLLEHVVGRIYRALTASFPLIKGGMIRLAKINPPIDEDLDDVAVKIEW